MKMNKIKLDTTFKHQNRRGFFRSGWGLRIVIILMLVSACEEKIPEEAYYTFTGKTAGEFLLETPETFSEFTNMLEVTGVMGLLKAYGNYTCFIPTNDAMFRYYESKGRSGLADFPPDTLKKMAYDHIIKDFEIETSDIDVGFLPYLTMSSRYLRFDIDPGEGNLIYTVNSVAKIIDADEVVHNGIIHVIDDVLAPTENTLVEAIASDKKFSLFFDALLATGLDSNLTPIEQDDYTVPETLLEQDGILQGHGIMTLIAKEKKYGFTALMESNETFAMHGINSLEDMKAYAKQVYDNMYPEDAAITDITNRKNSFNRFIAYHLLNKKVPRQLFIEKYDNTGKESGTTHSIQTVDMFEYMAPMCPNTLLEVRTLRNTNEYDVFNMLESGEAIRLTDDYDNDAVNGVYHEIDGILVYTQDVERMLTTKRLRMDGASFLPELVNNNIRIGQANPASTTIRSEEWRFPEGYFKNVKTGPASTFGYINADDRFQDYQGDEIFLTQGLYDITITTHPIPAGTYEIRFGYQPTPLRGVAQLYWDGLPAGIPLNLSILASDPRVGWVLPGEDEDDPEGYENDKMMRNRGYMKAPASFQVIQDANAGGWYTGTGRNSDDALRRILGIYTFDETATHTLRVKAIKSGQFMFDYLEFVPIEVLEFEDIY